MDLSLPRKLLRTIITQKPDYLPLMIRFAWHCCGTYDKYKKNGGSNGCTMRFAPEKADPENKGFQKLTLIYDDISRQLVESGVELSMADLYILGGYVAIQSSTPMKLLNLRFQTGRKDFTKSEAEMVFGMDTQSACPYGDGKFNPHGSRLPAADLGPEDTTDDIEERSSIGSYETPNKDFLNKPLMRKREKKTIDGVRGTFTRLGFDDKETVALLLLGHQYGQCHPENSGYDGFWYAFAPNSFNLSHGGGWFNMFRFIHIFEEIVTPEGKRQYVKETEHGTKFMMLISDMVLYWDKSYNTHVEYYIDHPSKFRKDSIQAWIKLTELGCENLLTPEARK